MLSLSRKRGEKVYLETASGRLEVMVTRINGDQVRLSFKVPDEVRILRSELDTAEMAMTNDETRMTT